MSVRWNEQRVRCSCVEVLLSSPNAHTCLLPKRESTDSSTSTADDVQSTTTTRNPSTFVDLHLLENRRHQQRRNLILLHDRHPAARSADSSATAAMSSSHAPLPRDHPPHHKPPTAPPTISSTAFALCNKHIGLVISSSFRSYLTSSTTLLESGYNPLPLQLRQL